MGERPPRRDTCICMYVCVHTVDGRNPTPGNRWFLRRNPMIYRFSTIPGGAGFRNHPQYVSEPFHSEFRYQGRRRGAPRPVKMAAAQATRQWRAGKS